MKTKSIFLFLLTVCSSLLLSCKDGQENIPPFLTIDNKTVNFTDAPGTENIPVKTSVERWMAAVQGDATSWIVTQRSGSNLRITVTENPLMDTRSGQIKVSAGNLSETVTVQQMGKEPTILVSAERFDINSDAGEITLEVTSNIDYAISIPADATWIKQKPETRAGEMVKKEYLFSIEQNTKDTDRETEITIKQTNGTVERKVTVAQKKYAGSTANMEVAEDIKVPVSRGAASSSQSGEDIEKSFDGDMKTFYHSNWTNTDASGNPIANYFPITLEYFFDNQESIDYLIYYPRVEGYNGFFKEVEIWASTEASPTHAKLLDYDFKGSSSPTKVTFANPVVKPKSIRLVVKSGHGDGQGFASCAEMEFYRVNPDNTLNSALLNVFTDITCIELKAGVTDAQIDVLPAYFGSIARNMRNGIYPRDFRIAQYHAYSITEDWATKLLINPRGVLDNATGIYGEAGEEIIVLVGNTHGNQIRLRCIEDGNYNGDNYMLSQGINKITLRNRGLFYIMYNVDNIQAATAKPITVHFPMYTGKVNGFWDIDIHKTDEKYRELLAAATYPYFDVKGRHMMLKFSTDNGFRKYVPDNILPTINFWDEMVTWQQSLMGWEGIYPEQMNNRMYARSTPTGYMSAQSYQTNFGEGALYKILNPTLMLQNEDDPWGPAHEIGHMNQGAINWAGITETSNNLFSNLIHHKMTSFPTRGQTIEENVQALLVEKRVYTSVGYTDFGTIGYASLRMQWQLYCYFHELENDTRFYPELFKISRQEGRRPIERNPGWSQLNFVRNACDAAKLDLTEFFEFWGFFRPIDTEINEYYKVQLTVTQQMVDETKQYVKTKGYPKPKYPIQYIEDRDDDKYGNVGKIKQFREQKGITKNISYTKNGNTFNIVDGDEAVCFEVHENDNVIFFSNKFTFTLPNGWWNDNCRVYAVQANGQRKELTS